jgi:hypothetical protein
VRFGRIAAAALALLLAIWGCSRPAAPSKGERNSWTIPGVVRIGADEEPDSLNLMYAHTAASDAIVGLLFSFILRYDAESAATARRSSCICAKASCGRTARR